MSDDRDNIELKLDEANELLFKVTIQGANAAPAKVRLVCENGDMSYMFAGQETDDGEIRFVIPEMKGQLKEGESYEGRVEVLIENRYFAPVEFDMTFKQSMKVVAEGVRVNPTKKATPEVVVQATIKKVSPAVTQEAPKAAPVQAPPVKKTTLAEKLGIAPSNPPRTKTGLDEKTMEEVANRVARRLLGGK